jgi:hypothetical protein
MPPRSEDLERVCTADLQSIGDGAGARNGAVSRCDGNAAVADVRCAVDWAKSDGRSRGLQEHAQSLQASSTGGADAADRES